MVHFRLIIVHLTCSYFPKLLRCSIEIFTCSLIFSFGNHNYVLLLELSFLAVFQSLILFVFSYKFRIFLFVCFKTSKNVMVFFVCLFLTLIWPAVGSKFSLYLSVQFFVFCWCWLFILFYSDLMRYRRILKYTMLCFSCLLEFLLESNSDEFSIANHFVFYSYSFLYSFSSAP